jgi:hypothetical protein
MDYQIQTNTRRCALSGRALEPGDRYFSVLLDTGGSLERRDYCADVWSGPPAEAFSFWSGRIALPEVRRLPPIDTELLMECFQRLAGQDDRERVRFRYIVALLLVRRKKLRLLDSEGTGGRTTGPSPSASVGVRVQETTGRSPSGRGVGVRGSGLSDGPSTITLRNPHDGQVYKVIDPKLSADEMTAVQDEVYRLLGWN